MSQRVLLTGANGFLGSHILSDLLTNGFFVRSIVRSQAKADAILQNFSSYKSQMDFGIVEDMTISGAFDSVVKSTPAFDTVIHQASPFMLRTCKNNAEILDPAIKGTTELLRAVKGHAPHVKRVIYTSSCATIINFKAPIATTTRKVYTENDWNPVSYTEAMTDDIATAYRASKKFAELAAWKFVEEEKPNFDLVTLCPPMIYGPLTHASSVPSVKDLNESNFRIYNFFFDAKNDAPLPPNGVHMYVDVRDLAIAHRLAATTPEASGNRIIISAGAVSSQDISDILRKEFPEMAARTPVGKPGTSSLPENAYYIENEKAKNILGCKFRNMEETFVDLGKQLLEIESSW
jgi:nucleoside-diphosphate-sugar epimerase